MLTPTSAKHPALELAQQEIPAPLNQNTDRNTSSWPEHRTSEKVSVAQLEAQTIRSAST